MKGVHSRTTRGRRRWRSLGPSVLLVCLAWPLSAGAQQRDALPGFGNDMTPAEVQRLFEAYELVRAQEMLDLSDEQYPQFVVGLKALQTPGERVCRDVSSGCGDCNRWRTSRTPMTRLSATVSPI